MTHDNNTIDLVEDTSEFESGGRAAGYARLQRLVLGYEVAQATYEKVGARLGLNETRPHDATVDACDQDALGGGRVEYLAKKRHELAR